MSSNHASPERIAKRVLIVRLGSMGDIIHTLPVAATLHASFPDWEIDWLVERRWRSVLDGNPGLARVIEFDTLAWRGGFLSPSSWRELSDATRQLRERQYDFALDAQGAIKSAVACLLSRAQQIVGFANPWLREPAAALFYSRRIEPEAAHVVEANLALAQVLGAKQLAFDFPLPQGDPAALPPELPDGELAVVNPGAGWQAKQWSSAGYAAVCDALEERFGLPVVLNCGPAEVPLAEEVRRAATRARPSPFTGGIPGLIALLRRACLVIAPDTGPLHLAAALGVPTVALFGPTDPARNGPYGNRGRIFRPENARTSHSRTASGNDLMRQINPEEVIQAAQELLDESRGAARAQMRPSMHPTKRAATQSTLLTSQLH